MTKLLDTYHDYEINYYAEILASTGNISISGAKSLLKQGQTLLGWDIDQVFDHLNNGYKVGA